MEWKDRIKPFNFYLADIATMSPVFSYHQVIPDKNRVVWMNLKPGYAILAILGLNVPYYFFVRFLRENGFDISLLIDQLFATNISTFFAVDVMVSALGIPVTVVTEGSENRIPHLWIPAIGTPGAGPSFRLRHLRETV